MALSIISKERELYELYELYKNYTCFDWYNSLHFKIIDKADSKFDLKTKETLHINLRKPNLNAQKII